jgi:hypothetical protein
MRSPTTIDSPGIMLACVNVEMLYVGSSGLLVVSLLAVCLGIHAVYTYVVERGRTTLDDMEACLYSSQSSLFYI